MVSEKGSAGVNASLVMVKSDGTTREAPLKEGRSVVGRDSSCRIRLPFADVSREHCELVAEDDALRVSDLGSSNGTFVNREKLDAESPRTLSAGDLLTIGNYTFVVRIDGEPASVTPEMIRSSATASAGADESDESDALPAGLLDELSKDDDASSLVDFDFDLSDDDEDTGEKKL